MGDDLPKRKGKRAAAAVEAEVVPEAAAEAEAAAEVEVIEFVPARQVSEGAPGVLPGLFYSDGAGGFVPARSLCGRNLFRRVRRGG